MALRRVDERRRTVGDPHPGRAPRSPRSAARFRSRRRRRSAGADHDDRQRLCPRRRDPLEPRREGQGLAPGRHQACQERGPVEASRFRPKPATGSPSPPGSGAPGGGAVWLDAAPAARRSWRRARPSRSSPSSLRPMAFRWLAPGGRRASPRMALRAPLALNAPPCFCRLRGRTIDRTDLPATLSVLARVDGKLGAASGAGGPSLGSGPARRERPARAVLNAGKGPRKHAVRFSDRLRSDVKTALRWLAGANR